MFEEQLKRGYAKRFSHKAHSTEWCVMGLDFPLPPTQSCNVGEASTGIRARHPVS
jgi:hypothetical protein